MNTILYKEIDGHDILIGFGQPVADPEATKVAVRGLLETTDEYTAMVNIGEKIAEINRTFRDEARRINEETNAKVRSGQIKTPAQASEYANTKIQPAIADRDSALSALEDQAKDASAAFEEKRKELSRANPVYCELKHGERMADDAEVNALRIALADKKPGNVLDTGGNELADNRDVVFWDKRQKKWKKRVAAAIGETPKGKKQSELTAEELAEIADQLNRERIQVMTPADRAAEKAVMVDNAGDRATHLRSRYEIEGDPDPLGRAQAWHTDDLARLDELYG